MRPAPLALLVLLAGGCAPPPRPVAEEVAQPVAGVANSATMHMDSEYAAGYTKIAEDLARAQAAFKAGQKPTATDEAEVLKAQAKNVQSFGVKLGEATIALGRLKPSPELAGVHKASLDLLMGTAQFEGRLTGLFATGDRAGFKKATAEFQKEAPALGSRLAEERARYRYKDSITIPPLLGGE